MLTKIKARYTSRCAETGKTILINEICLHDRQAKKVYKLGTKKEKEYNEQQATGKLELIRARFTSRCAETAEKITTGEPCYYDRENKLVYCMRSTRAKSQFVDNTAPETTPEPPTPAPKEIRQPAPRKQAERRIIPQPQRNEAQSLFDSFLGSFPSFN